MLDRLAKVRRAGFGRGLPTVRVTGRLGLRPPSFLDCETVKDNGMILKDEIPYVTGKMLELSGRYDLEGYVMSVRLSGDYRSLRKRVAWDLIRMACGVGYICGLYDKYGCDDSHITTLALNCMDKLKILGK